jgi:hypothetical protein
MTFRLGVRGQTREEFDAELEQFAEIIRAPMNASPQPVEIVAPTIDVLRPGGGRQAVLALLELVRKPFDPEGCEAAVIERGDENGVARVAWVRSRGGDKIATIIRRRFLGRLAERRGRPALSRGPPRH